MIIESVDDISDDSALDAAFVVDAPCVEGPAVVFVAAGAGTGAGEEAVADASGVEAAGVVADIAFAGAAGSSAACNYHQGRRMSRRAKGLLTRRDMDTLKLVDASASHAR